MESDDLGCTEIAVLLSLQALAGRYCLQFLCNQVCSCSSTCCPEEVAAGTVSTGGEEVLGWDEQCKELYWEVLSRWLGQLSWSLGLPWFMALPSGPQEAPRCLLRRP